MLLTMFAELLLILMKSCQSQIMNLYEVQIIFQNNISNLILSLSS
jgi:hypothetical protein